jgi:hypothetical protein
MAESRLHRNRGGLFREPDVLEVVGVLVLVLVLGGISAVEGGENRRSWLGAGSMLCEMIV